MMSMLIEPFRKDDRDEAMACLKQQGGLDHLSLAFYKAGNIGNDQEWDNWRLEGPSFVWYFRGDRTSTSGSTSPTTLRWKRTRRDKGPTVNDQPRGRARGSRRPSLPLGAGSSARAQLPHEYECVCDPFRDSPRGRT